MSEMERVAGRLARGLFRFSILFVVFLAASFGCSQQPPGNAKPAPSSRRRQVDVAAVRPKVEAFCGDCHAVPPPASFARADWLKEVRRGFELYWDTGRTDLEEPLMHEVVAYYESLAPQALQFDVPAVAERPLSVRFRREDLPLGKGRARPAVASLMWEPPTDISTGRLWFTDMRHGDVAEILLENELTRRPAASLGHPASIDPADLNGNGGTDYLIADLGSFQPEDHDRGRVLWMWLEESAGWKQHVLLEDIGRVAQAVDGDFDGDGDSDVLVAEFGWKTTGAIHLLRRTGDEAGMPVFEREILDRRHGVSFVVPTDWDGDGDLDFVALVTQEHESVELFMNDGSAGFTIQRLFAASDPAFGSSGIELADMDQDGDVDVLYTNGDSMDSMHPKPYHAVRWLENEGSFPFREHVLTTMPGVYKAVPADFDADGDLDVAAIALPGQHASLHAESASAAERQPDWDVLIVLEQTESGQFARHELDSSAMEGLALLARDFDGDGDIDLASGSFSLYANAWVTLWWNEGAKPPEAASAR